MLEIGVQRQIPVTDPWSGGRTWRDGDSFMHWQHLVPPCPPPLVDPCPSSDVAHAPNPRQCRQQRSRGVPDPTKNHIEHIASIPRLPLMRSSGLYQPCDTSGMSPTPLARQPCPVMRRQWKAQLWERSLLRIRGYRARRERLNTQCPPTMIPLYGTSRRRAVHL